MRRVGIVAFNGAIYGICAGLLALSGGVLIHALIELFQIGWSWV